MNPQWNDFVNHIKNDDLVNGSKKFESKYSKKIDNSNRSKKSNNTVDITFVQPSASSTVMLGNKKLSLHPNDMYIYHRDNTLVMKKI